MHAYICVYVYITIKHTIHLKTQKYVSLKTAIPTVSNKIVLNIKILSSQCNNIIKKKNE